MSIPALQNLPQIITAIGGVGTAAFGLVDASKVFAGGPNHIGFEGIRTAVIALTGDGTAATNALSQARILATLQANWLNGTDLGSQKAIAKSLIKLNLSAANAPALAAAIQRASSSSGPVRRGVMNPGTHPGDEGRQDPDSDQHVGGEQDGQQHAHVRMEWGGGKRPRQGCRRSSHKMC